MKKMKIPIRKKPLRLTPSQTIMVGFLFMISVGTFLLNLPIASKSGKSVGLLNALFTATSANCVTGLVVVNTKEHWTWFGKAVILLLMQFGALGFMTVMTVAMLLVHHEINLRTRQAIQASFNQDNIGGMVKLVKNVMLVTAIFEGVGAVLLSFSFYTGSSMGFWESVYQGVFHSVSAFCNAGFDNIGPDSMIPFPAGVLFRLFNELKRLSRGRRADPVTGVIQG